MPEGISELTKSPPARLQQAKEYFGQAVNLIKAKHYLPAERLLKLVLKIIPSHPNSHQLLSVIAAEHGKLEQALKWINAAIMYQTHNPDFYYNRAMIYQRLHKPKQAILDLEHIIAINPSYYPAHLALGRVFHSLEQYPQAVTYYEQSLKWVNTDESVWNDLSSAYQAMQQYANALKCSQISLHLNVDNEKTLATLGMLYQKLSKWEEAKHAYTQALQLKPNFKELLAPLFICKNRLCDWDDYEVSLRLIKEELSLAAQVNQSFSMGSFEALSLPFTSQELYQIAKNENHSWLKSSASLAKKLKFKHYPHNHQRLRIAYISSSFRDFPTGHLTQDLYALHDRNCFEIFVYSYGENDESIYRQKIQKGCDHFIDIRDYSIEQACQKIYADKIDILIDLMGSTTGARLEINALRPAPINVRYLGAPSTSGAEYFDYLIADGFITPPSVQSCYTEHLVLMPHSYQVNPLQQTVSANIPTRAECGLPEEGIVFCVFNNSYKIEPMIFQTWMNILQAVPDSVLWLQASGVAQNNLIQQAQRYNITAERLVFANRMTKDRHLARHMHADLYLDTHFYNAHTTASDALWMNVPVITYPGSTFQSRVAGSLLNALGLNELIMPDLKTYETTAISLALDPNALKQLKQKLKQHCQSYPLFDTKRFVGNLEKAYIKMWENYQHHKKSLIVVQE